MSNELRFGVLAPQVVPYVIQSERWRELEAYGFDSLWFADHFVNPARPSGRWFESQTLIAAAAAQTRTIRIGALVCSITLREPVLFAKQAMTLDHISNGRLELGIGAGGAPNDVQMAGLPQWSAAERARRFREYVQLVDKLLGLDPAQAAAGSGLTFAGQFYAAAEAVMDPGPVQRPRPPLTLAAGGRKNMRFAASIADSWNQLPTPMRHGESFDNPAQALEMVRSRNRQMDEFCTEAGREPSDLRRSVLVGGGVTDEQPWASPNAFEDFVSRYCDAGVNEFIFYYPSRAEQAHGHYERIARELIPTLKHRYSTASIAER